MCVCVCVHMRKHSEGLNPPHGRVSGQAHGLGIRWMRIAAPDSGLQCRTQDAATHTLVSELLWHCCGIA